MIGYHLQISFLHDIIFLGDDAKLHMWSFFKLPLTSILFSPLTISGVTIFLWKHGMLEKAESCGIFSLLCEMNTEFKDMTSKAYLTIFTT